MLETTVFFAGWGGDSYGWECVPGVRGRLAGNHSDVCTEIHELNFPHVEHLPPGDVRAIDLARLPYTPLFWAAPACPEWVDAKGVKRNFDTPNQLSLGQEDDGEDIDDPGARERALINQIPRYLKAMAARGEPVLAGGMECVVECWRWGKRYEWLREIQETGPGYHTRVIALNSMHATARKSKRAPQSRDRLYIAFSLKSLGRKPDWDKWLRPKAYCPACDQVVDALQVFKRPGDDMGTYGRHGQYLYRCPMRSCRHQIVEPFVEPGATAIDWTLPPGDKISERDQPLRPATIARVRIGLGKFGDAPFIAELRGGGSKNSARGVHKPLATFAASGTHHGLVQHPSMDLSSVRSLVTPGMRDRIARLMVERHAMEPVNPLSGRELEEVLQNCTWRMLTPLEIRDAMAFPSTHKTGNTTLTQQIRGYGNAVTPPVAENIGCALVEAVTGEDIDRYEIALAS